MTKILLVIALSLVLEIGAVELVNEALNYECVNSSYMVDNSSRIKLLIPSYSVLTIEVDLRHLKSAVDLVGVTLTLRIFNVKPLKI